MTEKAEMDEYDERCDYIRKLAHGGKIYALGGVSCPLCGQMFLRVIPSAGKLVCKNCCASNDLKEVSA